MFILKLLWSLNGYRIKEIVTQVRKRNGNSPVNGYIKAVQKRLVKTVPKRFYDPDESLIPGEYIGVKSFPNEVHIKENGLEVLEKEPEQVDQSD